MPRPPGKGGHRGWTDPTAAAMGVREVGFVFSRILCIRDELLPRPQSPWTNFDPVDEFAPCPRTINAVGLRSACVPVQSPFCNHQRLRERAGGIPKHVRTARPSARVDEYAGNAQILLIIRINIILSIIQAVLCRPIHGW